MSRATADIDALRRFMGFGLPNLIRNVVVFAGVLILCVGMNWRLALLLAVIVIPGAAFVLPPETAFWVGLAAAGAVCLTSVVNAWGRRHGPLLVAPALALLFLMNIFPLMWSFGLSFFNYRANRMAAPNQGAAVERLSDGAERVPSGH